MLGTSNSELGEFELGADFAHATNPEPELQRQRQPQRGVGRSAVELDERTDEVDPLLEDLFREKPEQPLALRDSSVDPQPQVVILKGDEVERIVRVETVVVQHHFISRGRHTQRRVRSRIHVRTRARTRTRTRVLAATATATATEAAQQVAVPARTMRLSHVLLLISIAIIGGVLIGMAVSHSKKTEPKRLRR